MRVFISGRRLTVPFPESGDVQEFDVTEDLVLLINIGFSVMWLVSAIGNVANESNHTGGPGGAIAN